ncbi:MAG: hypothetical protein Kow0032_27110 [Methyloligellaceae bacterium]
MALDLGDGHAVQTDIGESLAHFIQLEWLDDGRYEFHGLHPVLIMPEHRARPDPRGICFLHGRGRIEPEATMRESNAVPNPQG